MQNKTTALDRTANTHRSSFPADDILVSLIPSSHPSQQPHAAGGQSPAPPDKQTIHLLT
jgi:hypothetical protein